MARQLDKDLEQYAYLVDEQENLETLCHFLYQSWTHIELAQINNVPSAFEHPKIGGKIDFDDLLNWDTEAGLAKAYALGLVDSISEMGKNYLLRFAVTFLGWINQAPDMLLYIGIIDDFFRAYGIDIDTDFDDIDTVDDWVA